MKKAPPREFLEEHAYATAVIKLVNPVFSTCYPQNQRVCLDKGTVGWTIMVWGQALPDWANFMLNEDGDPSSGKISFHWLAGGIEHSIAVPLKDIEVVEKLPAWGKLSKDGCLT